MKKARGKYEEVRGEGRKEFNRLRLSPKSSPKLKFPNPEALKLFMTLVHGELKYAHDDHQYFADRMFDRHFEDKQLLEERIHCVDVKLIRSVVNGDVDATTVFYTQLFRAQAEYYNLNEPGFDKFMARAIASLICMWWLGSQILDRRITEAAKLIKKKYDGGEA